MQLIVLLTFKLSIIEHDFTQHNTTPFNFFIKSKGKLSFMHVHRHDDQYLLITTYMYQYCGHTPPFRSASIHYYYNINYIYIFFLCFTLLCCYQQPGILFYTDHTPKF